MTASITYLRSAGAVVANPGTAVPSFEAALKEVEKAQALLGLARVQGHRVVAQALKEAERLEESAQFDLEEALARFHFAGGSPEDLTDLDLGSDLESVVEMATTPLGDLA
jgi:hypothetical protein